MFARDGSRWAGSEARGEGRERGYLSRIISKPPVAQRAGGINIKVARSFIGAARSVSQINARAEAENNKSEDFLRCADVVHFGRSVTRCHFMYIL